MPRRRALTETQLEDLFALPIAETDLVRHWTLDQADLAVVERRCGRANRLGYTLQLCAFRYPGRLLRPGDAIPEPALRFVAEQLRVGPGALLSYAARPQTRREQLDGLRATFGVRMFASGHGLVAATERAGAGTARDRPHRADAVHAGLAGTAFTATTGDGGTQQERVVQRAPPRRLLPSPWPPARSHGRGAAASRQRARPGHRGDRAVEYCRALDALRLRGDVVHDALLAQLAPLGWQHINLTGDYLWGADSNIYRRRTEDSARSRWPPSKTKSSKGRP